MFNFFLKLGCSGYPDQLKGKEIPLGSRILAIVNFFVRSSEASRSQGTSPGVKETFLLLKEEAGKKFDPKMVEQFELFCKNNQPFPPK